MNHGGASPPQAGEREPAEDGGYRGQAPPIVSQAGERGEPAEDGGHWDPAIPVVSRAGERSEPVEVGEQASSQEHTTTITDDGALRIESGAVAIRRLGRALWSDRILLVLAWILGGASYHVLGVSTGTVCWTPLFVLGATALIVGRRHGAAIVGASTNGKPGALIIDAAGVTVELDGKVHRFARADIAAGWTETAGTREDVVLSMTSGTLVRVAVANGREGADVLHAVGVAANQRAVTMRLGVAETSGTRVVLTFLAMLVVPFAALMLLALLASLTVTFTHGSSATLVLTLVLSVVTALTLAALWLLVRPLVTTTLRIGTDGIAIKRLWRRRFVPRAAFTGADVRDARVVILRTSGVPVGVATSGPVEAEAVVRRILEATTARRAEANAATLARLDRHGRSLRAWVDDLRALAKERGAYRDAPLDPSDLLDVVEDGGAPAERRIAAAAALSAHVGEGASDARDRIRIAADACADPKLRIAIAKAAAGEIEEDEIDLAVRAARES